MSKKKIHLIPGTMCNEQMWQELLPYLQDSFELVYLSVPQGKGFDEIAEYFNKILGNETVNLVGFSLGGYVATYFAIKYPQRVEKLFIISNSPTHLPQAELKQRGELLSFAETHGYKGVTGNRVAQLFETPIDRLLDIIIKMDGELGEQELVSQYKYTTQRTDHFQDLCQLPLPVHFYYSENDAFVNSDWLNRLKTSSPNLRVTSTSGSGHMLPLEKPAELAGHIQSWMKS